VAVVLVSRCDELVHLYLHLLITPREEQFSKRETAGRSERGRLMEHLSFSYISQATNTLKFVSIKPGCFNKTFLLQKIHKFGLLFGVLISYCIHLFDHQHLQFCICFEHLHPMRIRNHARLMLCIQAELQFKVKLPISNIHTCKPPLTQIFGTLRMFFLLFFFLTHFYI